jgi:hypothetical protein
MGERAGRIEGVMRVRVSSAMLLGVGAQGIAALLALLSLMTALTRAQAQSGAGCSAAFHSAMGEVLAKQGESLGGAVTVPGKEETTCCGTAVC